MGKELELLDVEIEKSKLEVRDTSVGLSMLTIFFLALIPLFYSIMRIYDFTFDKIQVALIISVAIIFIATILSVMHWEQNTTKLKKLYAQKIEVLNRVEEVKDVKRKK